MKRLLIIGEGHAEKEFSNDLLYPHFLPKEIIVRCPLIKWSAGGIVPWKRLRKEIELHLKQDTNVYVTTLIDYYGIKSSFKFPKWGRGPTYIDEVERGMKDDINSDLNSRFIPYIQMFEFEGLLFNNIDVFKTLFERNEISDWNELQSIISNHPNPETINDGPTTAPSKRLSRLIETYDKVVYGSHIAQQIGLQNIISKCPRFSNWIETLENI
jgi:hypothetical protein